MIAYNTNACKTDHHMMAQIAGTEKGESAMVIADNIQDSAKTDTARLHIKTASGTSN